MEPYNYIQLACRLLCITIAGGGLILLLLFISILAYFGL